MASKAKTEDKSARSRRTADKSAGRKTSDPQKAFEQDLAAARSEAGVEGPPEVASTAKEAAKSAAEEAKEAGVSPQAVLHSAPDGYGSGTGETMTFDPARKDENLVGVGTVPKRTTPTETQFGE